MSGAKTGAKIGAKTGAVSGWIARGGACALVTLALGVVSGSQLRAANILEKNFWLSGPRYDRDLPACDFPGALDRIIGDFRTKEFRFWKFRTAHCRPGKYPGTRHLAVGGTVDPAPLLQRHRGHQ